MSEPTAHQRLTRAGLSAGFADLVLERHAHELAEQIRAAAVADDGPATRWNWWDAATIPGSCADLIDPKAQR